MVSQSALLASLALATGVLASSSLDCTASTFASLTLSNIDVLSLNVTAARNYSTSSSDSSSNDGSGGVGVTSASTGSTGSTVDICLIAVTYTHPGQNDVVNTYIGLPLNASSWNGRFLMNGGGGWTAGGESVIISPVASGYTSSSTDGGHNSTTTTAEWGFVSEGNTNWPAL